MARDINKTRLKSLKRKSYAKKKAVQSLDSTMNNITRRLFPKKQAQPKQEKAPKQVDYSKKIAALEKKLAVAQEGNSAEAKAKEKATQKSLNQLRNALTGQMQSLGQSTMQNDKALQAAIDKAGKKVQPTDPDETKTTGSSQQSQKKDPYGPHNNYGRALEAETQKATAVATSGPVTNTVKKIQAKIGEYVGVGSHKYKVTNIFGKRSGDNTVPGREGKHSRGIDVVGTDAQGRNTNIPIAIADGVIKDITLDGSGEAISPTEGSAGGYIMDVQLPNGKVMRYMHLGKDVMLDREHLVGKSIKRGDVLHNRDNSKGSGSQTGPHTKISITSVGEDGKYLRDYDNEENDPTPYLFGKA